MTCSFSPWFWAFWCFRCGCVRRCSASRTGRGPVDDAGGCRSRALVGATGLAALSGTLCSFWLPLFAALMVLTGGAAFSRVGAALMAAVGPVGLIGFQFFRVPVAVFLRECTRPGRHPVQITYEGAQLRHLRRLDRTSHGLGWYGAARWDPTRYGLGMRLGWCYWPRRSSSQPSPCRRSSASSPTSRLATFATYVPYIWLPTVLAPAALLGHLLVLRWLLSSCSGSR